jgi:hypothetical protein
VRREKRELTKFCGFQGQKPEVLAVIGEFVRKWCVDLNDMDELEAGTISRRVTFVFTCNGLHTSGSTTTDPGLIV